MVYPVQMIARPSGLKRQNGRSGRRRPDASGVSGFGRFLEEEVEKSCPAECHVVTYDASCQLKTYSYRSRDYTF